MFTDRFDPFAWTEVIRRESVALTSVVPTLLAPLLQGAPYDKVPGLRGDPGSSAPLDRSRRARVRGQGGVRCSRVGPLGVHQLRLLPVARRWPDQERNSCCSADEVTSHRRRPLAGTEVKVVGLDGADRRRGARRALRARAQHGCWRTSGDPDATAAVLDATAGCAPATRASSDVRGGKPQLLHHRPHQRDHHSRRREVQPARHRAHSSAPRSRNGRGGWSSSASRTQSTARRSAPTSRPTPADEVRARLTAAVEARSTAKHAPKVVLHGAAADPAHPHRARSSAASCTRSFAQYRTCKGAVRSPSSRATPLPRGARGCGDSDVPTAGLTTGSVPSRRERPGVLQHQDNPVADLVLAQARHRRVGLGERQPLDLTG